MNKSTPFFMGLIALFFSSCGGPVNVSTLQDTPPGLIIANHFPSDGAVTDNSNQMIVRFGVDQGINGFNASGPSYIVQPGTTTPPLQHDFQQYPNFIVQNPAGQLAPFGPGGVIPGQRTRADGSIGAYTLDIGRDPNSQVLRQLREAEPARYNPNRIATPQVPGYGWNEPQQPPPEDQGFYPPAQEIL